jgi:signal transduction histidine kinase
VARSRLKPLQYHTTGSRRGLLAGRRIRIKLIILHTCFSLALAGILILALRPAVSEVVKQAEAHEAGVILSALLADDSAGWPAEKTGVTIKRGTAVQVGLDATQAAQFSADPRPVTLPSSFPSPGEPIAKGGLLNGPAPTVAAFDKSRGEFLAVSVVLQGARDAVIRLYTLVTIALLAVYALVAAALELFVLPQHVYGPIRTMLDADAALQEGRFDAEIIPDSSIPADELGEIMRSRNASILAVRRHEADLADALRRLEEVATDLKRKNHLLETARRNMADADRLASLGLMSAGIAHEINTPLAVLKGLVEKLDRGHPVPPSEAALMLRVVGRLERLSESLLDFARIRESSSAATILRPLIDEAWTLVRLDRAAESKTVELANDVPSDLQAWCDGDRMVQVFVNLLRNAVDAIASQSGGENAVPRRLAVTGETVSRPIGRAGAEAEEQRWASLTITDDGPGIDPEVMARLFEPFASTRLDAKGTGLGLAVAEGIVREHGGVIVARNRTDLPGVSGAVFQVILPVGEEVSRGGAESAEGGMSRNGKRGAAGANGAKPDGVVNSLGAEP